MKAKYRGWLIEANREESMIGDKRVYFCIIRESDGFIFDESSYDESLKVREVVADLKYVLDDVPIAEEFDEKKWFGF